MKQQCKRCGAITPYNRHDKFAGRYGVEETIHKCNYTFWRRIEEFGEGVKG